jgi:6-phosphogluconolactonase
VSPWKTSDATPPANRRCPVRRFELQAPFGKSFGSAPIIMHPAIARHHSFYIGTYTRTTSLGIYGARIDSSSGALSSASPVAALANPTWLTLHPSRQLFYANQELKSADGKPVGAVAAFSAAPPGDTCAPLNVEATDATLCHTAVDHSGKVLIAVSYSGGQVSTFPLAPDGRIGARRSFVTHQGPLGPQTNRQDKPHPHSVTISPDNRLACVTDLGLDRVFCYDLNAATATIAPAAAPFLPLPPGTGPRHAKFSADGRFLYVIGELANTVTVFSYDAGVGAFQTVQSLPTLPADFAGESTAAEIRIHPNGRFLYGSNRGHDSLVVYAIAPSTGRLTWVETVNCGGVQPRNFDLTPDGAWLVCAHQGSDSIVSFRVDSTSGRLALLSGKITVAQPVCILFA